MFFHKLTERLRERACPCVAFHIHVRVFQRVSVMRYT